MKAAGARRLFAKRLAANDNSKNQIYLGGDFSTLQLLPFGPLIQDDANTAGSKRSRLKATISLGWLLPSGGISVAPDANLILYPKYPEVRLSGFARGVSPDASARVVVPRAEGRWLFIGVTHDHSWIAAAYEAASPCSVWADQQFKFKDLHRSGALFDLSSHLPDTPDIVRALGAVADLGWIDSKRLDADGNELPYVAPNGGGYTLEAALGIRPNGRPHPDFHGWEVKQFSVTRLDHPLGSRVTLFTPEPDGGFYTKAGAEGFVRRFGAPDGSGITDRLNFVGTHYKGKTHERTKLRLHLRGWEEQLGRITDFSGGIELRTEIEEVAASWSFPALLNHWKEKHAKAVYVPSIRREPPRQYRFGRKLFFGEGTDFPLFIKALSDTKICYDPGIKLENASTAPHIKKRSQFRIRVRDLIILYISGGWREV